MIVSSLNRAFCCAVACGLSSVFALAVAPAVADDKTDFFEKRIRPVLAKQCAECHTGKTPEGNFRIDKLSDVLKGGMKGPGLIVGKPEVSELIKRLETKDKDLLMPPEKPLTPEVIADFKRWIKDGAVWPDSDVAWKPGEHSGADAMHWSFRPLAKVTVPKNDDSQWAKTDIDRFIKAKLDEIKLKPVALADRRTLIRRVTLDLIGLPPTPEDIAAFVNDAAPNAFEKVIDRLLASPAYGERWGRHWLDLARYADTSGDGTDMPVPEARYYRDYVIDAFNRDMPYDQFLIEQIAGDQLAKETPNDARHHERIIATGYIALSRRFGNSRNAEYDLILDDTIDTIGRSVMGLTLGCARCHHHKFDPVTMEDYYGLYGYFNSTLYPHAGTEHQKERADFIPISVSDELKAKYDSPVAWAVQDKQGKDVGDSHVQLGGDRWKKGALAKRGFLSVFSPDPAEIPAGQSGRLQFARWLVSNANPLTPRVLVNRLWAYHFGRGLVPTTSSFGKQAPPPSHPELLDWLATDFISNGWSIKRMHKQMLLSATYQLSSDRDSHNDEIDEPNIYRWRFDRLRLDAETLRDSILAVTGTLESGSGGRHPFRPNDKLNYTQSTPFTEVFDHNRRSVYLMTGRLAKHPFMALYDGPDPNKSTEARAASTVALQALSMMNSPFIREKAGAFAKRLLAASPENQQRIGLAYELALGRAPTDAERADVSDYVGNLTAALQSEGRSTDEAAQLAWTSFARTLLSSNEFVYCD